MDSLDLEKKVLGSQITSAQRARAVLEFRAVQMLAHARRVLPSEQLAKLRLLRCAGGGAQPLFAQILANVFQCEAEINQRANRLCSLGAVKRCLAETNQRANKLGADTAGEDDNRFYFQKEQKEGYERLLAAYTDTEAGSLRKFRRR